jgi:hypothetical protein
MRKGVIVARAGAATAGVTLLAVAAFGSHGGHRPTVDVAVNSATTVTTLAQPVSIAAVKGAFSSAMVAERRVMMPTGSAVAAPWAHLAAAQVQAVSTNARMAIASSFTGLAATQETAKISLLAAAAAAPDAEELGTGVSSIDYKSVTVHSPSDTTVHAVVTVWSRQAGRQPGGSWTVFSPSAQEDTTATLTEVNGHWLVSSYHWNVVPGTGP